MVRNTTVNIKIIAKNFNSNILTNLIKCAPLKIQEELRHYEGPDPESMGSNW